MPSFFASASAPVRADFLFRSDEFQISERDGMEKNTNPASVRQAIGDFSHDFRARLFRRRVDIPAAKFDIETAQFFELGLDRAHRATPIPVYDEQVQTRARRVFAQSRAQSHSSRRESAPSFLFEICSPLCPFAWPTAFHSLSPPRTRARLSVARRQHRLCTLSPKSAGPPRPPPGNPLSPRGPGSERQPESGARGCQEASPGLPAPVPPIPISSRYEARPSGRATCTWIPGGSARDSWRK